MKRGREVPVWEDVWKHRLWMEGRSKGGTSTVGSYYAFPMEVYGVYPMGEGITGGVEAWLWVVVPGPHPGKASLHCLDLVH